MIALSSEQNAYKSPIVSIKVVGVGGAGGNTVNSIIASGYDSVEFIAVNTDLQALDLSKAEHKVQIGIKSTKGLGTGANPEIGKRAAEEDLEKVMDAIGDADIVFLTAGMGGGTGSGALPVLVQALKEKGILSIVVVTKPFLFEGKRRQQVAQDIIAELQHFADTLIVIPNQRLLDVVDQHVSMVDAFAMINDVLSQSVRGVSDIITRAGHINVDYADVRAIMKDRGLAVMGTGRASGADRAQEAALQAISSPLFENVSIEGARGVLLNITGGSDLGIHEISKAASIIYEKAHEDANIILGSVIDESMGDEVMVTIIATGFDHGKESKPFVGGAFVEREEHVAPSLQGASVEKVEIDLSDTVISDDAKTDVLKTASELVMQDTTAKEEKTSTDDVQKADQAQDNEVEPESTDCPLQLTSKDSEDQKKGSLIIDPNDLDVPTFLREK